MLSVRSLLGTTAFLALTPALAAPPEAPTSLTVGASTVDVVGLFWADNALYGKGYGIERKLDDGRDGWRALATVGAHVHTYLDAAALPNTWYRYRVRAFNDQGFSAYSNELRTKRLDPATQQHPAPDPAAGNLSATPLPPGTIRLNVGSHYCISGCKVMRAGENFLWQLIATLPCSTTSYLDTTAQPGQLYRYYLDYGQPGLSNTIAVGLPPEAPSNLVATALSPYLVRLTWKDNSLREDQFVVERSVNGGTFALLTNLARNATKYDDGRLAPQTRYTYRVKAVHSTLGASASTVAATATTPVDDGSYDKPVNAH